MTNEGFFEECWTPIPKDRHPLSQKFHDYLREAGTLHDAKQRDYGLKEDPFANVRASADWGMPAWVGAMVRLNDKVKRLQTLARTGRLSNEGAIDSFNDIAVYAIIARILFEEDVEASVDVSFGSGAGNSHPA